MIPFAALRAFAASRLGLGLIGALLLCAVLWRVDAWHEERIAQVRAQAAAERDAAWQQRFDTMARAASLFRQAFERERDAAIAARRSTHEHELRGIAAAAADLRVRGPGRAAAGPGCRPVDNSRPAASAGGYAGGLAGPDAPGPGMPEGNGDDQFAVVPWEWLTRKGREFDALLSEARTWRASDAEQRALLSNDRLEDVAVEFGR